MAEVIVKRYGSAFYSACDGDSIRECLSQLKDVCEVLQDYIEVLRNPIIEYERKRDTILKALDGYDVRVVNLILLLTKNNHISELKDIYDYVNRMYMEEHNIKVVKVISARPLNADVVDRIYKKLGSKAGYTLKLEHEIDPHILGGFQLKFDDRILDLSVVNRLREVKKSLQNVDVSG